MPHVIMAYSRSLLVAIKAVSGGKVCENIVPLAIDEEKLVHQLLCDSPA
jgi:hypothetical protein